VEGLRTSGAETVVLQRRSSEMKRVVRAVAIVETSDEPGVNITGGDRPERVRALRVNAEYSDALSARRSGAAHSSDTKRRRTAGPRW
jgi:hypothetical protein